MQTVMTQQDGRRRVVGAGEAGKLGGRLQRTAVARQGAFGHHILRHQGMADAMQRHKFIQPSLGPRCDCRAAARVVAGMGGDIRDGVRPVERVIQAAPTRIGGVQGIARVRHRDDQLRTGQAGDLVIDIGRRDRKGRRCIGEIADFSQEGAIGSCVESMGAVPGVDLRLQGIASRQQVGVAAREPVDQPSQSGPKGFGGHA